MVSIEEVKARIQSAIACDSCEVEDTSCGCGTSFNCRIVSPDFEGLPLIQRHRKIMDLFKEELKSQIHAFNLTTLTPTQAANSPK